MQAQETILFLAVAALAAALIVVIVAPRLRGGRPPSPDHSDRTAAAPPDSADAASRLGSGAPASDAANALSGPGAAASIGPPPPPLVHMICPTCRRQFAAGVRYCPYDARVLTADSHQPVRPSPPTASAASAGKICPSCARRYDAIALVCGRDGTALVSVN